MGLLAGGVPLRWEESSDVLQYVRDHGVEQFLNVYKRMKHLECPDLMFGDEIEYGIFKVENEDHASRTVKLSLRGDEIMRKLIANEEEHKSRKEGCQWLPEYGNWMVEGTPKGPFSGYAADLVSTEYNLRLRRKRMLSVLEPNEIVPTVTCLPNIGCGDFTSPSLPPGGEISESCFLPDGVINPHPRFGALTRNIRTRRGSKVDIRVPLFHDVYTPGFGENMVDPPTVHMDSMGFGMGCCCTQMTFQSRNVDESRYLFDQLAVLSPIMMALSAATPILKGRLVDTDVRWHTISSSVDDRTPEERGETSAESANTNSNMAGGGTTRLSKSRYDSISTYLHYCHRRPENPMYVVDTYGDIACEMDEEVRKRVEEETGDPAIARHIAHLFTRDPLVIFSGQISELDDSTCTEHWENIQSTNWQTVRWKPPPPRKSDADPLVGWRTEFRSLEVQLTDAENAAFISFVVLVTRVILAFDLNLYIPLSKVDENMQRAHTRNGVLTQKFWWRKHMAPLDHDDTDESTDGSVEEKHYQDEATTYHPETSETKATAKGHEPTLKCEAGDYCNLSACDSGYEEMTVEEIMLGKDDYYPGLIPLVYAYIEYIGTNSSTVKKLSTYLELLSRRAIGELPTVATWMRNFVRSHPNYKDDSVVSPAIAHDLMVECAAIGEGQKKCEELLGDMYIHTIKRETAYEVPLTRVKMHGAHARALLEKYRNRKQWDEDSRCSDCAILDRTSSIGHHHSFD